MSKKSRKPRRPFDYAAVPVSPLAAALSDPGSSVEDIRKLLAAGADPNAVRPAHRDRLVPERRMLDLAVASAVPAKVELLFEHGATTDYAVASRYTALVNACYSVGNSPMLVPMIEMLIAHGADLNASSVPYNESPLRVTSFRGRFDAVRVLLQAGADPTPLGWNEFMMAIGLGDQDAVTRLIARGADLTCRDTFDRTPMLLAVHVGDLNMAKLIHAAGGDINDEGRMGDQPLCYAVQRDDTAMAAWLLDQGADCNAAGGLGGPPLFVAAASGATGCLELLIAAGADLHAVDGYGHGVMQNAMSVRIAEKLADHGCDWQDVEADVRRELLGLGPTSDVEATGREFSLGWKPRRGRSNPEPMQVPFWNAMVRAGCSAYSGRKPFAEADDQGGCPTWCYQRYGMSLTLMPDGRFVEIGGEHEDFYDPDFYIYNDVIVHDDAGQFAIYGYPKTVFPPTDFHSATLVGDSIYIIGGLGYQGSRASATTPVYKLDCKSWQISVVKTTGENPGWIYKHKARPARPGLIEVFGGTVCRLKGRDEEHEPSTATYSFSVQYGKWRRCIRAM